MKQRKPNGAFSISHLGRNDHWQKYLQAEVSLSLCAGKADIYALECTVSYNEFSLSTLIGLL